MSRSQLRSSSYEKRLGRMSDMAEGFNPPDTEPFKRLACSVILSVAKSWIKGHKNEACRDFFLSEDYLFWAFMANIDIEGEAILDALERNGGVSAITTRNLYNYILTEEK